MLRRGKGKWCFAGVRHRAACGSLGQIPPCPRAKSQPRARQPSPSLEQGPAVWRKEGSPLPLETGQENEQVDRAEARLGQTCKTSPSAPRELRRHSQGSPRSCRHTPGAAPAAALQLIPADPMLLLVPVIHGWNATLPSPAVHGKVCFWVLSESPWGAVKPGARKPGLCTAGCCLCSRG